MANNKDRFSVTYDEAQSKATKNYNGNYNASSNNRLSSSYEEALGKATAKSALKSGIYNENNFNNSLKLYLNGVQKVASKYGQKSYVWNDDDKNEISDLTFQRDSLYDYVSANKDMFDEDTYNELLSSFDSHNYIFDLANNKISGITTSNSIADAKNKYVASQEAYDNSKDMSLGERNTAKRNLKDAKNEYLIKSTDIPTEIEDINAQALGLEVQRKHLDELGKELSNYSGAEYYLKLNEYMSAAEEYDNEAQKYQDRITRLEDSQNQGVDIGTLIKGIDTKAGNQFWANVAGVGSQLFGKGTFADELGTFVRMTINQLGGDVDETANLADQWYQTRQDVLNRDNLKYSANVQNSELAQAVDKYGTMVWSQAPSMLLTAMGFWGGTIGEAANVATSADLGFISAFNSSSKASQLGMAAQNAMTQVVKDPLFWNSYVMESGSAYSEALQDGASQEEARVYSAVYGVLSAMVEVSDMGIEKLPKNIQRYLATGDIRGAAYMYAKSILGEIGEEETQDIISKGLKGIYNPSTELYSNTNEDAIINPNRMLETAKDTAITTAVMGGIDTQLTKVIQNNSTYAGNAQELIDYAKLTSDGSDAKAYANKLQEVLNKNGSIKVKQANKVVDLATAQANIDDVNTVAAWATNELESLGETDASTKGMQIAEAVSNAWKNGKGNISKTNNLIEKAIAEVGTTENMWNVARALSNNMLTAGATASGNTTAQNQAKRFASTMNIDTINLGRGRYGVAAKKTVNTNQKVTTDNGDIGSLDKIVVDNGTIKAQVNTGDSVAPTYKLTDISSLNEEAQELYNGLVKEIAKDSSAPTESEMNDIASAFNMYTGNQDIYEYIDAFSTVRNLYGKGGVDLKYVDNSKISWKLSETQKLAAYKQGMISRPKTGSASTVSGTGKVSYGTNNKLKSKVSVSNQNFIEATARALNIDIVLFESKADKEGKLSSTQGMFKDGVVYIDVYGSNFANKNDFAKSKAILAKILSHEVTHSFEVSSPEQYAKLSAFVLNHLAENSFDALDNLVMNKKARAALNEDRGSDRTIDYDQALREIVADACETMIVESEYVNSMAMEDPELYNGVKKTIKALLNKIRSAIDPSHYEAKILVEKHREELIKLWDDAAKVSAANRSTHRIGIETDGDSASPVAELSERSWKESDYFNAKETAAKDLAETLGVSVKQASKYIDDINSIAKMIASDRIRLDYDASPGRSAVVSNSEYGGSIDFSTLCKKRRWITGTFSAIQNMLPNTALTAEDILKIRDMMKSRGYEVNCGLCYVEGSRTQMGIYALEFLVKYKKEHPDVKLTLADVNTAENLEKLRISQPEVYAAYEKHMNGYAQRKPKLYQLRTDYKHEILNMFGGKNKSKVPQKNTNGGFRLQSFSDFEIVHMIDTMQVLMDMSRVGLAGQAYTKVPEFAWAFGGSGLKINLSLIAKDVDANGNLVFDDVEGINHEEAFKIRDYYSDNVGTILVVFTVDQLKAALADSRVDYIIPFHRSQWNKGQYESMGLPAGAMDFTMWQNESYITPVLNSNGKKTRPDNYMPNAYWDFTKTGKENAEAYLKMCYANNRVPKFSKLLVDNGDGSFSLQPDGSTDGYWKLLIDFKMYNNEGVGSPQLPVTPNFNMEKITDILNNYEDNHNQFPVARDVVDDFIAEYKAKNPRDEYSERELDNGQKTVYIAHSDLSARQLTNTKSIYEYLSSHIGEFYTILEHGYKVYLGEDLPGEYVYSKYSQDILTKSAPKFKAKARATSDLGELIETAHDREWEKTKHPQSKDAKYGMYRFKNTFSFPLRSSNGTITDIKTYDVELLIRNASDGKKYLYDIVNIKENTAGVNSLLERETRLEANASTHHNNVSNSNIPQSRNKSNGVFSEREAPVSQEISSAKTSIMQIPALFKDKNTEFVDGGTNVDIGGGRFDLATNFLKERNVTNYIFDPYNRDEANNSNTLNFIKKNGGADTATCANVLNVIAEKPARENVILEVAKSIKPDGTAYFMVYEGDGTGTGRVTGSGWQNNRKTATYAVEIEQFFGDVTRKGKLIIAKEPIINDQKASWELSPGMAISYSEREAIKHREDAKEHFGTTEDFKVAGYLTTDGSLLDFSGAHWLQGYDAKYIADWKNKNDLRQVDHEDIFEVIGSSGDNRLIFINEGNIRMSPEAPGVELSSVVEPNAEQYNKLRDYFEWAKMTYPSGTIYIDTVNKQGRIVDRSTRNLNEDIVSILKQYYKTGKFNEVSSLAQFRYSERDSDNNQLSSGQLEYFKDSKARDEQGRLLKLYHGSQNEFTIFNGKGNSSFGDYKFGKYSVSYFTTSKSVAEGYSRQKDYTLGTIYSGYANVINPYNLNDEMENVDGYSKANGLKNRSLREFQIELFNDIIPELQFAESIDEVNDILLPFNARVKEFPNERFRYELFKGGGNFLFSSESFVTSANDFYDLFDDENQLKEDVLGITDEYGDDDYYFTTDMVVNLVLALNEYRGYEYDGIIIDNILDSASLSGGVAMDVITIKSSDQFKNANNLNPTSDPDIRFSERDGMVYSPDAMYKPETLDSIIKYHKYGENKSDAYVARISIDDFLKLTTTKQANRNRIADEARAKYVSLDEEKLSKSMGFEQLFLSVDMDKGKVIGHEGRHRSVLMKDSGVKTIPVIIVDRVNRYSEKSVIPSMTLKGQNFYDEYNRFKVDVDNIIPLTESNRDLLVEQFATPAEEQSNTLSFSERDVEKGININDSTFPFTEEILRGNKTIETRDSRSLDPYIGKRVGIVRTGVGKATLVGYATIGEPVIYTNNAEFDADYDKHLVDSNNPYYIKPGQVKYGYPLTNVVSTDTMELTSKGIVSRGLYSERDNSKTDREMLVDALETLNISEEERTNLEEYRKKIDHLNELDEQLEKELSSLRKMQKTEPFGDATKAQRQKVHKLSSEITNADKALLELQNAKPLMNVLKRSKQQARTDAAANAKSYMETRHNRARYRDRVTRLWNDLAKMGIENTNKNHLPEFAKEPILNFLTSIDMSSMRKLRGGEATKKDLKMEYTLKDLADVLQRQQQYISDPENFDGDPGTFIDLPLGFTDEMKQLAKNIADITSGNTDIEMGAINLMNASQLKDLAFVLQVLKSSVKKINTFATESHFAGIQEASKSSVTYIDNLGSIGVLASGGAGQFANNFFEWANATPYYVFKRFGQGGMERFNALSNGWGKMAMNVKETLDFVQKLYSDSEVKEWERNRHQFELEDGTTVIMTEAQIMSLWCLMKRDQAMGHIEAGGIRIGNIDGDIAKGLQPVNQVQSTHYTIGDLTKIVKVLSVRQMEIANALQNFMNTTCSAWGNEVSMARFGYRAFTETAYFPIETDSNTRPAVDPEKKDNGFFRLLNLSATKALTPNANNALVLSSIFDVFADHTADMAKYNGLALPILDMLKWYNFQDKERIKGVDVAGNETYTLNAKSVQKSIEYAFGKQGQAYFTHLIKDLNGIKEGGRNEGFISGFISRYKVAAVSANLRVVVQQPTAIVRAATVIDPKYLTTGMLSPKSGIDEALKYSGIAVWKDLGYFDTNVGRNMRDQIKHSESWMDKVNDVAMKGAEWGDKLTWGAIWNAAKAEVKDTQGLSGDDLLQATAQRFNEIILSTQVIDSTITRSDMMRSKSLAISQYAAFMSEPTLSYNILLDAKTRIMLDARQSGSLAKAWKKNGNDRYVYRAMGAYLVGQAVTAMAAALIDAIRDDDEYMTYWEKWLAHAIENFKDNINPLSLLPVLSQVADALLGNSSDNMALSGITQIGNVIRIGVELAMIKNGTLDEPTKTTYYGNMTKWGFAYKILQAISSNTGLPVYAATREAIGIWNLTVGKWTDNKIYTYRSNDKRYISDAYKNGYLTEDESIKLLMDKEIVKDSDEAYWLVDSWSKGYTDDSGKYDLMLNSLISGDEESYLEEVARLEDNGINPSTIRNQIKSKVHEWYSGDEEGNRVITDKDKAKELLMDYAGVIEMEADDLIDEWTCVLSSPEHIAFEDIESNYADETITENRAKEMLMTYGGYTKSEADATLLQWKCKKVENISYSSVQDAYIHGDIDKTNAIRIITTYSKDVSKADAEEKIKQWDLAIEKGIKYSSSEYGIKGAVVEGYVTRAEAEIILRQYNDPDKARQYSYQYEFTRVLKNKTGEEYSWSNVQEAVNDGVISDADLKTYIMNCDGKVSYQADQWVEVYRWRKNVPQFTVDDLERYNKSQKYIDSANLTYNMINTAFDIRSNTEADKDEKGSSITNSRAKKIAEKINQMNITSEQKTALMELMYVYKTVKKVKLW